MTAIAVVVLVVWLAPHAYGAWRGLHVGRTAVASHRQSVRAGVRLGRWQAVAVVAMTLLLIGART